MEEQAQQALFQLIERAVSGIDQAVEFSQAQLPDVVEQLLLWKTMSSGALTLVGLAMLASVALYWRFIRKGWDKIVKAEAEVPAILLGGLGSLLMTVFGAVLFLEKGGELLKLIVAPKLYLLEYAASLVK